MLMTLRACWLVSAVATLLASGCRADSFVKTVTLPRIERGLASLMQIPFEAINFLMPMYEYEFQNYTDSGDALELLYAQFVSTEIYTFVGFEDGRFFGYANKNEITFNQAGGTPAGLAMSPHTTLTTVNDDCCNTNCAESSWCPSECSPMLCRGEWGKVLAMSCPGGAVDSAGCSTDATALAAAGYHENVTACCDENIRAYYTTSVAERGRPINFTRWRVYNPRGRTWYVEQKARWESTKNDAIPVTKGWSSPYSFATGGVIGITATGSIIVDNKLVGVIGADYTLASLSVLLVEALSVTTSAINTEMAYVVERSGSGEGMLVGTTISTDVLYTDGQRLTVWKSTSPAVVRSAEILKARGWAAGAITRAEGGFFEADSALFTVQDGDLDWLIVSLQNTTCTTPQVWSFGRCETCPDGTTPQGDSIDDCTLCPTNSVRDDSGTGCNCIEGFYSLPGHTGCHSCPPLLLCGGGAIGKTYPLPPTGWWYDVPAFVAAAAGARRALMLSTRTEHNNSEFSSTSNSHRALADAVHPDPNVYLCRSSHTCVGSSDGLTCDNGAHSSSKACCADSTMPGGTLCSACQPGYGLVAERCAQCTSADVGSIMLYVGVYSGAVWLLWFWSANPKGRIYCGDFLVFLQHLAFFLDDGVHDIMRVFISIMTLDLDPINVSHCLMDMTFYSKFFIGLAGPALVLLPQLLMLALLDYHFVYPHVAHKDKLRGQRVPSAVRARRTAIELAFFTFTPSMLWCLKMVSCSEINGVSVLNEDSSIECYNGFHMVTSFIAYIIMLGYVLFMVVLLILLGIRRHRQQTELVLSRGRSLDRAASLPVAEDADAADPCTLHVRGVSGELEDERVLQRKFKQFGRVKHVTVRHREEHGQNTSWALVTMSNQLGMDKALTGTVSNAAGTQLSVRRFDREQSNRSVGGMTSMMRQKWWVKKRKTWRSGEFSSMMDETRGCLKALLSKPLILARANKDLNGKDLLQATNGDRIVIVDQHDGEKWLGYNESDPEKYNAEFPPSLVHTLSVESLRWNSAMTQQDSWSVCYLPYRSDCFWWPSFMLACRALMVVLFAGGSVSNFDRQLRVLNDMFASYTGSDSQLILATIDWKAAAAILLALMLIVQLKMRPCIQQRENDFGVMCSLSLLVCALFFLGTEHHKVARILFFVLLVFLGVYFLNVLRQDQLLHYNLQRGRRKLHNGRLKMKVGLTLLSWLKGARIRRSTAIRIVGEYMQARDLEEKQLELLSEKSLSSFAVEIGLSKTTTDFDALVDAKAGEAPVPQAPLPSPAKHVLDLGQRKKKSQKITTKPAMFTFDERGITTEEERAQLDADKQEVAELLESETAEHADDIAASELDTIVRKLRKNEWPRLSELKLIKVEGRPHEILNLLYSVLCRDKPLETLVLDISKQDPMVFQALKSLCKQNSLEKIAANYSASSKTNLRFARNDKELGISNSVDYEFWIRGPILQCTKCHGSARRAISLVHLGGCELEVLQGRYKELKILKRETLVVHLVLPNSRARAGGDQLLAIEAQSGNAGALIGGGALATESEVQQGKEMGEEMDPFIKFCDLVDVKSRMFKLRDENTNNIVITKNLGNFIKRPVEMCIYLASRSKLLAKWDPVDEDHLMDFAEKFELLACDMVNECQSGAEAEAAIRTGGTTLLGKTVGYDIYSAALEHGLKDFLCSKWIRQYTEDMWESADLHLHRTGIAYDLRKQGAARESPGTALAREIKAADANFRHQLSRRLFGFHTFFVEKFIRALVSVLVLFGVVCLSPLAEALYKLNKKGLTTWLRRQIALEQIAWSYPHLKCSVAILLHVAVLALCVIVPASKEGSVPDNSFSTGESLIFLYAVGYMIAEVSQLLNLLLENFRAQSIYEAYKLVRHHNELSHTKQLVVTSISQFWSGSNLVDILVLTTFTLTFISRRLYVTTEEDVPILAASAQRGDPSRYFFAVNILFLTYKMLDMMKFINHLGPLLITMGRMLTDILLFSFIAAAVILAFGGAFQTIYQHQISSFNKFGRTIKFCVMTFFGEWEDIDDLFLQEPIAGPLLFIPFLVLGTIVQLNLLIAMLTSTYEEMKQNSAKEWRLSRSRIVAEFTDQVRSVTELPILNIGTLILYPLCWTLFPSVWAKYGDMADADEANAEHAQPVLMAGKPYYYNDRRTLYLLDTRTIKGHLQIWVKESKNLKQMDGEGKMNEAYCLIESGEEFERTETVKEVYDPVDNTRVCAWEEEKSIEITSGYSRELVLTVFDDDLLSKDDAIGRVRIDLTLKKMEKWSEYQEDWYPLKPIITAESETKEAQVGYSPQHKEELGSILLGFRYVNFGQKVDRSYSSGAKDVTGHAVDQNMEGRSAWVGNIPLHLATESALGKLFSDHGLSPIDLTVRRKDMVGKGPCASWAMAYFETKCEANEVLRKVVTCPIEKGWTGAAGTGMVQLVFKKPKDESSKPGQAKSKKLVDFGRAKSEFVGKNDAEEDEKDLILRFFVRDYRHPFVTFFEQTKSVELKNSDTVGTMQAKIWKLLQESPDINLARSGWSTKNLGVVHVRPENTADMRHLIGPYDKRIPGKTQFFSTLLVEKDTTLRDYFSLGRRTTIVNRLLEDSMFLVVRKDRLLLNPQQELHRRWRESVAKQAEKAITMDFHNTAVELDLHFFRDWKSQMESRFQSLEQGMLSHTSSGTGGSGVTSKASTNSRLEPEPEQDPDPLPSSTPPQPLTMPSSQRQEQPPPVTVAAAVGATAPIPRTPPASRPSPPLGSASMVTPQPNRNRAMTPPHSSSRAGTPPKRQSS